MTRINREQLLAFAANELTGPEADEVAAHLAAHPDAARTVETYRAAAAATARDDSTPAPADLVARAQAIFRAEAAVRPGLADRLRDVIAHLVYDSRLQPAATRASAAADLVQLSFEAGDYEIDLRAEPNPAAAAASGPAVWRVVGQVLSAAPTGRVTVTVLAADAIVATAESDDRAMFRLELPEASYDLRITAGDEVIVVNGVGIG